MMKFILSLFLLLLFCNLIIKAQAKIPETITKDFILKPSSKPYESTGFIVEKGATLTILPGTKINMSVKPGEKANFPIIEIKGGLKVGAKGFAKSAPVVFEGADPMLKFNEAELEINGMELNNYCIRFFGNTTGYVNNCSFIRSTSPNSNYDFEFSVPKVGVITFQNCLFENQGIVIKSKDFPNDLENLKITNCAFTTRLNANKKKLLQHFVPITLFAYATKCDLYLDIEFKPFDWAFKKPVATEWYIADERFRKMTEDSVKLNKTISMKFPSKAFTSYKQMEATPDKETKKEEK